MNGIFRGGDKVLAMKINMEETWERIHDKLRGFVAKHINEKEEVDDIVQETFVKIKLNIDKLENPSKVNSWIYQIARNNINDYYRAKKRMLNNDFIKDNKEEVEIETDDFTIQVQTQYFSEYAGLLINQLPEKYKEAVFLADIQGINQKELAEKLNISVSGAKSRVQRGRQKIKDIILQCCDVNADVYGNIIDYAPKNRNNNKS